MLFLQIPIMLAGSRYGSLDDSGEADKRQALLFGVGLLRIVLPALSLGLLVIDISGRILKRLFARLERSSFLESGSGYQRIVDRAAPSDRNRVVLPPDADGILPVVVPVKSIRRGLVYSALALAVLSYVVDGAILIAHSIVSGQWEPIASDNGLWSNEVLYLVGCSIAVAVRTVTMAFDERTAGLGKFRRSYPFMTAGLLFAGETALLGVIACVLHVDARRIGVSGSRLTGGDPVPSSPGSLGWWTIAHVSMLGLRVLCFLLATLSVTSWLERTTYLPNEYSALAREQGSSSATASGAATPRNGNGYGTFGSPAKPGNGTATNGQLPGKSSTTEKKLSFWSRIKILSPYLWPKKSRTLQFVARSCSLPPSLLGHMLTQSSPQCFALSCSALAALSICLYRRHWGISLKTLQSANVGDSKRAYKAFYC